jgi:adenosylmethionine---8-amino-7-oxononanoate aminotransferase
MDNERHRRLADLDRRHLWHPFTQMKEWMAEDPVIIDRAEGNYLVDTLGRRYLDGVSSLWCNIHGHRRRELDDAIRDQLGRVAHSTLLGLASPPSIELAARLTRIVPRGLTRVFYSDSGATSVEIALKMAFQYWQLRGRPEKSRFVGLAEAYHGDTVGSVSLGGIDLFHDIFRPLLFPVERLPTPHAYRWKGGERVCLEEAAALVDGWLAEHGGQTAAFVIEPLMQGAAGMIAHPPGFLSRVASACRRHDVLLVCDEVATGFGRTGKMFACEHENVTPDLLCLAKGITGGYLPLAATIATEEIFSAFLGEYEEKKTFFHGHTYTGNPLACAVALASLEVFDKDRVLDSLPGKIETLRNGLAAVAGLAHVGDVRQRGLMIGIELVRDRSNRLEYAYGERIGQRVCLAARKRGVMLRPLGNVVVLMPPLSITQAECSALTDAVRQSIAEVTES